MIEIRDQFVCRITVGTFQDFILTEDLIEMSYFESAGLNLPFISITFVLRNLKVLKYLNEGNVINVSMGRSELSLSDMQFMLTSDLANKNYTLGSNVTIKGVLYKPKFVLLSKETSYSGTSINVINEICSKHFSVVSNVTRTNDAQEWFQTGISDRQMVRDLWFHSYVDNRTFIAMGFDNNTIRIKDMRKALLEDNPWIFSINQVPKGESSKVVHFGQFWTKNDYGAINSCIGRGLASVSFNVDTGEFNYLDNTLKNFSVMSSNKLNILDTDVKKYSYSYISDEVSKTYDVAFKQNIRNLLMFSTFKIFIPTSGPFKQFRLLDSAQLEESAVGSRASGRSFITRIYYTIKDRKFSTNLTLCKEAPNEIQGDALLAT